MLSQVGETESRLWDTVYRDLSHDEASYDSLNVLVDFFLENNPARGNMLAGLVGDAAGRSAGSHHRMGLSTVNSGALMACLMGAERELSMLPTTENDAYKPVKADLATAILAFSLLNNYENLSDSCVIWALDRIETIGFEGCDDSACVSRAFSWLKLYERLAGLVRI